MSAWKQVKCSLCNKHLTHLGSQNILSFSVDTESNETELENLEQRAWCVLCKQVLQQSSSAWLLSRLPLSGTQATGCCPCASTMLIHGAGAVVASQGFWGQSPGLFIFVLIFTLFSQFLWLLEARCFSIWTVAVCTPKALQTCKKDIFNISSVFLQWQTWLCIPFVIQAQRSRGATNSHK